MNKRYLLRWHPNRMAIFMAAVLILALIALQFQPVFASANTPRFAPPNAKPYGKSLGEWGIEWWRYIFSLPGDSNPLNDPTGANCGFQQSGPVFFLVGTTGGSAHRKECVVPVGTALFFPILNIVGSVPEDGATSEEMVDLVKTVFAGGENINSLKVTLDGVEDGVELANPKSYFFTDFLTFTGHEDNIYENLCGGRDPGECYVGYHDTAYAEGYWAFVHPLPPGVHEIKIYGEAFIPEWNYLFTVDVTYDLTVVNPAGN